MVKNLFRIIQNKVAVITKQRVGLRRYLYGEGDNLPNVLLRSINDSGTATACVSRIASFIQGEGFINENAKKYRINATQNGNQFLEEVSYPVAIFEGFVLKILCDLNGNVSSIYKVSLKQIRRKVDGQIRYNPRMGEIDYLLQEDKLMDEFNPYSTPQERAIIVRKELETYGEQVGTIFYPFKIKEYDFGDIYPIPDANSGLEDIISDASLQRLEKRNITKGFKPNVAISMAGKTDDLTIDENGKTESDYLDETIGQFVGDEASSVILLEGQTKDAMPQITIFPLSEMLDGVEKARVRVANAVCRHFSVPPVLIGLEVSNVLGNAQAIYNSLKMFMLIVKSRQQLISESFSILFPNVDWTIKQLNIYDYLPTEVLAQLTSDEVRKLGGYEPLNDGVD